MRILTYNNKKVKVAVGLLYDLLGLAISGHHQQAKVFEK